MALEQENGVLFLCLRNNKGSAFQSSEPIAEFIYDVAPVVMMDSATCMPAQRPTQ
jgi:hypothetical protein